MSYRYTLTVPAQRNDGTPIEREYQMGVLANLTDIFGGCTVVDIVGAWQGPDRLYVEPGFAFQVDTDNDDALIVLQAYAEFIAEALAQECVYLTRVEIETWLVAPSPVPATEEA